MNVYKYAIISLLVVVLFSCKNDKSLKTVKLNDEMKSEITVSEQNIVEIAERGKVYYVSSSDEKKSETTVSEQSITEFAELEKVDYVGGFAIGYAGSPSEGWSISKKIILLNYSSELIEKEYYKTNSLVAKIYLYWILKEKRWENTSLIYNDLMKYGYSVKLWCFPGGCFGGVEYVKDIVDMNLIDDWNIY